MLNKEVIQRFRNLGIPEFTPRDGPTGGDRGSSTFGLVSRDVLISHLSFPAHTAVAEHTHDQLVVCCVRGGAAVQRIGGEEYHIAAGNMTIIFPGQRHSLTVLDESLDITEIIISDSQAHETDK